MAAGLPSTGPPAPERAARLRPPLSPRTKLFQTQQFDLLKALDIVLLNISAETARQQLREDFRRAGDTLSKEEFIAAVLRILPAELQFRSPAGMGDGMENAALNVGERLSLEKRRAVAASLVDRVDTDGDEHIDWEEMSAFILYQSAVVTQSDFSVGRILPYRPLSEGGAVGEAQSGANAAKEREGFITTDHAKARLTEVMAKRQATLRRPIEWGSLTRALRPHPAAEVAKAADALAREQRRAAAAAVGLNSVGYSPTTRAGPFNRSGVHNGVSLLKYIPEADLLAAVEPKSVGLRLLHPDDLSEAAVITGGGRAIEAVSSFVSRAGSLDHPYLVTSSASAAISIIDLSNSSARFETVNSWPTPDSQQSLMYTYRYNLLFSGSSSEGAVHAWNVQTGKMLATMRGHSDMCTGIADLAGEDRIASCSHDKTVRVWDVTTCRCDTVLTGHVRGLCAVDVYEDRGLLVTGSYDHTARVWSPRVSKAVMVLDAHATPLVGVSCVPDTSEVVTASVDGDVCVWDMRSPRAPVHKFSVLEAAGEDTDPASDAEVTPMTAFAMCLRRRPKSSDAKAEVRTTGAAPYRERGTPFTRKMPRRSPAGSFQVPLLPEDVGLSAKGTPSVVVTSEAAMDPVAAAAAALASARRAMAAAGDESARGDTQGADKAGSRKEPKAGKGLLKPRRAGEDGRLDHEAMARRPRQVEVAERQVQQLVFGIKTLHSFTQRESPELLENSHKEPIVAVGYSPLNNTILSAAGPSVRVWSALVGVLTGVFEDVAGEGETIASMLMDPRGVTFVLGTESGRVRLHNATSGHCLRELSSHHSVVPALAWFGRAVVSGGWDGRVLLHSLRETPGLQPDKHTEIGRAGGHSGRVTCLAASDNLGLIVTGGTDSTVRVYNASTSQLEKRLRHNGMITAVSILPEMGLIVSTDISGTLFVWAIKSGGARYQLAAAFRHRPIEWLDRTKLLRQLARRVRINQQKRKSRMRFVLGIKDPAGDGKADPGDAKSPGGAAAAGARPGKKLAMEGLSPRRQARAQQRREMDDILRLHDSISASRAKARDAPSLAERMFRGEHGAMDEFRKLQEAKRLGPKRGAVRLRSSILLGAGVRSMGTGSATSSGATSPALTNGALGSSAAATPFSAAATAGFGSPTGASQGLPESLAASPVAPSAPSAASGAGFSGTDLGSPSSEQLEAAKLDETLRKWADCAQVLSIHFDLDDCSLYTTDDEGWLTSWDLKELFKAIEVQSLRSAMLAGVDTRTVKRRLSVGMTDADVMSAAAAAAGGRGAAAAEYAATAKARAKAKAEAAAKAKAEAEAKGGAGAGEKSEKPAKRHTMVNILNASKLGAFDKVRQPVLPEGTPTPIVIASGLLRVNWRSLVHTEAVTGLSVIRNPHMPETVITGGFDRCVRGTDAADGTMIGRLCQKLTRTGVNPHWQMDVDCESWRSEASAAAEAAVAAADATVAASMDSLSGVDRYQPHPRSRASSSHDWGASATGVRGGGSGAGERTSSGAPPPPRHPPKSAPDMDDSYSALPSAAACEPQDAQEGPSGQKDVVSRAAAAVPLDDELRFSLRPEAKSASSPVRSRVANALRQVLEGEAEEPPPAKSRVPLGSRSRTASSRR
ncbi:hypothetical protein FNF28_03629 [Cafeteria roenbergensis]|uniref:EF-hand domain-containing protein n=2 Tax=Cafeteria roenbergensis TaxID=33653 RepID=A0A5A8DHZ3_CAFRO|nr:hypothetical protein FNF28_03629 [Cafeteria roenbergensis]